MVVDAVWICIIKGQRDTCDECAQSRYRRSLWKVTLERAWQTGGGGGGGNDDVVGW